MAKIFAVAPVNFASFDIGQVRAIFDVGSAYKNQLVPPGVALAEGIWFQYSDIDTFETLVIAGDDLAYEGAVPDTVFWDIDAFRLVGGSVQYLRIDVLDDVGAWTFGWEMSDFSYSAVVFDRAMRSSSTRDDAAFLRLMLSGDDELVLSDWGDDVVMGYDGDDEIYGRGGNDILEGGRGHDFITGADGIDNLFGGLGNDDLSGGNDDDFLDGGNGHDLLAGGAGDDWLLGGIGRDELLGGDGNDVLYGGAGADEMSGDSSESFSGDDQLYGGGGSDKIYGEGGNDWLEGETGHDLLDGGDGGDQLYGGAGNDRMDGGAGDDILEGGEGNDTLAAGEGNDVLRGGAGRDRLTGGAGMDFFVFESSSESTSAARDRITDFDAAGGDRIDLSAIDARIETTDLNDPFVFKGDLAFSGHWSELRAFKVGRTGNLYRVEGDTDGDGVADFSLDVVSTAALTESDFILS
jgi:Ca2+-binding RTX toxin-like protein